MPTPHTPYPSLLSPDPCPPPCLATHQMQPTTTALCGFSGPGPALSGFRHISSLSHAYIVRRTTLAQQRLIYTYTRHPRHFTPFPRLPLPPPPPPPYPHCTTRHKPEWPSSMPRASLHHPFIPPMP